MITIGIENYRPCKTSQIQTGTKTHLDFTVRWEHILRHLISGGNVFHTQTYRIFLFLYLIQKFNTVYDN